MTGKQFASVVALGLSLVAFAACGPKEPVAAPEPTPGEATGLDGAVILQEKCTVCHNLDRVHSQQLDAVGWASIVDLMIVKGADVTTDESAALAEYLSLQ